MNHLRILAFALALCAIPLAALASAPPQVVRVNDLDYIHRTYYFIADHPIKVKAGTLHVWRDDRIQYTNVMETLGMARPDPNSPDTTAQIRGYFSLLQQDEDYSLVYPWVTGNPGDIPVLRLRRALKSNELLAVSYVDELLGAQVGSVSSEDYSSPDSALGKPVNVLLIKLIAMEVNRPTLLPPEGFYDTTDPFYRIIPYELRNFYNLGLVDIPQDRFQLKVRRIVPGETDAPDYLGTRPLLEWLGLDQKHDPGGQLGPDGIVDDQFLDYEAGIIYFPDLHPFAPDTSGTLNCSPNYAGFLCLDNVQRNILSASGLSSPSVYSTFLDRSADIHYYLESTVRPPPEMLSQNAPNPFNPGTRIGFHLDISDRVRISVYDVHGRLVSQLFDMEVAAGYHSVFWNGTSGTNPVASGVYYYVLETGGHTYTKRMVLAR